TEAQRAARVLADQAGLGLVELEALLAAPQPAGGQEPLVDVAELAAEAGERAAADHPGDLALEFGVGSAPAELALEQERGADLVALALAPHRVALALAALAGGLPRLGGAGGSLPLADRGQQGPVDDEIRVTPDRRGEVAVGGASQPRVAGVALAVGGLL